MKSAALVLCTVIGYLLGHYLLPDPLAVYASMLIAYHLLLVFLVVIADREKGMSLPVGSTILTHLACLAILIGVAVERQYIPLFGIIRYFIPALAPFEADWLFSGGRKKAKDRAAPEHIPLPAGTADDYDEFLRYLAQKKRAFSKPGRSLREEHVVWMADRARKQAELEPGPPAA
jgi:hypothetical protein